MKGSEARMRKVSTYSSIKPGEEPPYRSLFSKQIDIEQGLQALGQVSLGLVEVEVTLEEW